MPRVFIVPVLALCFAVSCSQGDRSQPAPSANQSQPPSQAAAPAQTDATAPASGSQLATTPPAPEAATPAATNPSVARSLQPQAQRTTPSAAPAPKPEPAAAEAEPARAPRPQFREVTIPAGTRLSVRLETAVASDTSNVEDPVHGTLTRDIVVDGVTVIPAGAEVIGTVRDAKRSGRVKGLASVTFRFERVIVRNEPHAIQTAAVVREAKPDRKDDLKKGAIGGGVGAIVGGIVGGSKGAAIGAAAGGAGTVLATRGDEVRLPAGTTVTTRLRERLSIVVPVSN